MRKIIICHCEDVTVEELRSALDQGYTDLESIKRFTGIGTGRCQGKCCLVQTIRLLAEMEGQEFPLPTIRPPVLPLSLQELAHGSGESTGSDRGKGP